MERAEIEATVIAILAKQLLLPPGEIARDARIDELGLDSLGKVEAIFAIEEHFGIHVPFNANAPAGRVLLGYPAVKMETHVEIQKALRRLPRLAGRVAALEKGE